VYVSLFSYSRGHATVAGSASVSQRDRIFVFGGASVAVHALDIGTRTRTHTLTCAWSFSSPLCLTESLSAGLMEGKTSARNSASNSQVVRAQPSKSTTKLKARPIHAKSGKFEPLIMRAARPSESSLPLVHTNGTNGTSATSTSSSTPSVSAATTTTTTTTSSSSAASSSATTPPPAKRSVLSSQSASNLSQLSVNFAERSSPPSAVSGSVSSTSASAGSVAQNPNHSRHLSTEFNDDTASSFDLFASRYESLGETVSRSPTFPRSETSTSLSQSSSSGNISGIASGKAPPKRSSSDKKCTPLPRCCFSPHSPDLCGVQCRST